MCEIIYNKENKKRIDEYIKETINKFLKEMNIKK